MGREVRRVPLDFDWPVGKGWEGFLNPHYTATKHGSTPHRPPTPAAGRAAEESV